MRAAVNSRFSEPVRSSWNPTPSSMIDAILPRVETVPDVGAITPAMSFSKVDLPVPLSPMMPSDSPMLTVMSTPSSAVTVSPVETGSKRRQGFAERRFERSTPIR